MIGSLKRHSLLHGRVLPLALVAVVLAAAGPALADGGANHQVYMNDMPLGVSGSSIEHLISKNRLFCYAGTMGSLITDGPNDYILSNNHVLAKENNPNSDALSPNGYQIIQQGLLDEPSCTMSTGDSAHVIAYLSAWVPILFGKGKNLPDNYVDAAIANVTAGRVVTDGHILDIGTVAGVEPATIGMQVQKSGRTTGHTFGTVEAEAVDIDVKYNSGTARFLGQMRIRGVCDIDFSTGGDSGSLIVNVPNGGSRLAVGLLFAGGGSDTFANHIATVLTDLGAELSVGPLSMVTSGATAKDDTANVPTCDGGDDGGGGGGGPGGGGPPGRNRSVVDPAGLEVAKDVKARHGDELFAIPGVVGHGVGADANGDPVIEVYVESASRRAVRRPVPSELEGIAVRVIETGVIRAY